MRPISLSVLPTLIALASLSACVSGPEGAVPSASMGSAAVRLTAFGALSARAEDLEPPTGALAGSAAYAGYILGEARLAPTGSSVRLLMTAALAADFDAGTLDGSFGEVQSLFGPPASGGGTLVGGRIDGDGISAGLEGEVTIGAATYDLIGTLDGSLRGEGGDYATGDVAADLSGGAGAFLGALAAGRQ